MTIYEYYNNILEEHKNDYLFLTRLEVTDHINGLNFENCYNLTTEEKSFLICAISQYWIDEDLWEHTLFDITELALSNHLEKLNGHEFIEKMDTLV